MPETELQPPPPPKSFDITGALSFAFRDPNWWRTAIPVGLCMFIPVIGVIVHLGWRRKMFHHIRAGGEGLIPLDFGEDLRAGIDPFLAIFTGGLALMALGFLVYLPGVCLGVLGAVLEVESLVGTGMAVGVMGHFAFILMALPGNALLVDFRRRGYHGERVPVLSPRESIRRIKTHFVPFVLMTVTTAIGGFIGVLGMYAACIGVFVTMPAGHAVGAHALAQWDKLSAP